jgi:hypothetical protein
MGYAGGAAGGAAAAAAAAIANAIKSSGAIVSLEPEEFQKILSRSDDPVIVHTRAGWPKKTDRYLTSYKGLFFYTKSDRPLMLPSDAEMIESKKIWIPG